MARWRLLLYVAIMYVGLGIGAPIARAHPGHGIDVDSEGNVYFVDLRNRTIWRLTPDGELQAAAVDRHAHHLIVDADDRVYFDHGEYVGPPVHVGDPPRLEDAGTLMISYWRLDESGTLSAVVPPTPAVYSTRSRRVIDDFANGLSLFRDGLGNSYSIVYQDGARFPQLLERAPGRLEGRARVVHEQLYELTGGTTSPPDLPRHIEEMDWGLSSLVVTVGSRVVRIRHNGYISHLYGDGDDTMVFGIAAGDKDVVYVADYGQHAVRRVDHAGNIATLLETGFFWSPTGVAVAGKDLLILLDRPQNPAIVLSFLTGPRVVRRSADGTTTTLVTVHGHRVIVLGAAVVVVLPGVLVIWRRRVMKRSKPGIAARENGAAGE